MRCGSGLARPGRCWMPAAAPGACCAASPGTCPGVPWSGSISCRRRRADKSGRPVTAGDANRLPFPDASFGAAVSIDVICHASVDPAQALAELHRVLRPGGTAVLNLPAYDWLRSAHDVRVYNARRFTRSGATRMLEAAGFTAIAGRYWNGLLLPLMVLQRKVLQRRPDAPSDVAAFPPWIDATLHAVSEAERWLGARGITMPGGGSVLMLATRP